jgi:hypothetical protein
VKPDAAARPMAEPESITARRLRLVISVIGCSAFHQ